MATPGQAQDFPVALYSEVTPEGMAQGIEHGSTLAGQETSPLFQLLTSSPFSFFHFLTGNQSGDHPCYFVFICMFLFVCWDEEDWRTIFYVLIPSNQSIKDPYFFTSSQRLCFFHFPQHHESWLQQNLYQIKTSNRNM